MKSEIIQISIDKSRSITYSHLNICDDTKWEPIDTSEDSDSIMKILVEKILAHNVFTHHTRMVRGGIYCIRYRNRVGLLCGEYTVFELYNEKES